MKVKGLDLINAKIQSYAGDFMAVLKNWYDVVVFGARWQGSAGHGEDGLHLYGGRGYTITGCHIYSGDDSISLTTEAADNEWLKHVEISDCVVASRFAGEIQIHMKAPATVGVRHVNISNVGIARIPHAGAVAAIRLLDDSADDSAVHDVELPRISIDMKGDLSPVIRSAGVDNLTIDKMHIVNAAVMPVWITASTLAATKRCLRPCFLPLTVDGVSTANQSLLRIDGASDLLVDGTVLKKLTAHALGQDSAFTRGEGRHHNRRWFEAIWRLPGQLDRHPGWQQQHQGLCLADDRV